MNVDHSVLPVGTRLGGGRYAIDSVIGRGGFGITYRATDTMLERPVAVKEFFLAGSTRSDLAVEPPPHLVEEFAHRRDRIRDEARVLARFRHPNIVTVHEFLEENDTIYVVMELLEGRSLAEVIEEAGVLDEATAIRYACEIAEALDAVHHETLLHRDVKPDNVMVLTDGRVSLVDFGTAREFALGQSSLMSQTLTPGYAPVEQYTAQGRFGPQTDVYALGATTYQMVTGAFPTPSLDRLAGAELAPPRQVNQAVSQTVNDAILWAMAVDAESRPPSAVAFAAALTGSPHDTASGSATRIVGAPGVAPAAWGTRAVPPPPPTDVTVAGPPPDRTEAPKASERSASKRPRRRKTVRRGMRKATRVAINLVTTVIIGIVATFAIAWFVDRANRTTDTTLPPGSSVPIGATTLPPASTAPVTVGPTTASTLPPSTLPPSTSATTVPPTTTPPSTIPLDPPEVLAAIALAVDSGATDIMGVGNQVWVANQQGNRLVAIDPAIDAIAGAVAVRTPSGILVAGGDIWVANRNLGNVHRYSPTLAEVAVYPVPDQPVSLAEASGAIWVVQRTAPALIPLDPVTGTLGPAITLGENPGEVVSGGGSLWVSVRGDSTVVRIDPLTAAVVETIDVGPTPTGLAFDGTTVWVTILGGGELVGIDVATNEVRARVQVGDEPIQVAFDGRSLWVAVRGLGEAVRVDPITGTITGRQAVDGTIRAIGAAAGSVWVATGDPDVVYRIAPG